MTPFFNPGPTEHPRVPIYISALNPYMARLAGELCDGLRLHPLLSAGYTRDVIIPAIAAGATKAGRKPSDVDVVGAPFLITGSTRADIDGHIFRVRSPVQFTTPQGTIEGQIASDSWGFGFGLVRFTGIVETLLVSSVTPIDGEYVDVRFLFTVKKVGNIGVIENVSKAFIAEIERQLSQDIPIWEHKAMMTRPVLCDGDGPNGLFRRWTRQFYMDPPEEA